MPENAFEVTLLSEDGNRLTAEEIKYRPRFVLGLDVGIASVGYALLDFEAEKILTLGSHLFEVGENPKDGSSLAEPRRTKRGQRRRLDRRRRRLGGLKNLFQEAGLLEGKSIQAHTKTGLSGPWELRVAALVRKLSGEELAQSLFHLAKRRGFKESLKDRAKLSDNDKMASQKQDEKDEEKKMLGAISTLKAAFDEAGSPTIGHFLLSEFKKNGARLRNQSGDYQHTVTRALAEAEARTIIERQRALGWGDVLSKDFEEAYVKLAFEQRPLKSVYHLVGECRFEHSQKRAARGGHSAELFILWSRLNNLRIKMEASADDRPLKAEEKQEALIMAYQNKSGVTFSALRKIVQKISPGGDDIFFNLVNYNSAAAKKAAEAAGQSSPEKTKKKIWEAAEKSTFIQVPAWHKIKEAIGDTTALWNRIKDDRAVLDKSGHIITMYPDAEQARKKLSHALETFEFDEKALDTLAALEGSPFKGYIDLSFKALANILPRMESGERYDLAASAVYGSHSQAVRGRCALLPPIKELRNPVVRRATSQARKVLNAIILRYGQPDRIHIEVARDLARNHDERRKYNSEQKEYLAYAEETKKKAAEFFGCDAKDLGDRFLKYRLWQEQNCHCLYSGHNISPDQLKDPTAVQIDHALPYSLTYDDSFKNKVLVLASQNQNKGNKTPYEFVEPLGHWDEFQGRLWHLKCIPVEKKKHLCVEHLTDDILNKFKARNLVDTGYIARTLKNHIENNLLPKPGSAPKWVQTRPGALTALLRQRWGLQKSRGESPRHHALDAAVLAASTEWMVQQAASWRREPDKTRRSFCPKPWKNFRDDLLTALRLEDSPTKKLFTSRRPERRFKGSLHEDTIKSCRVSENGVKIIKRVKLTSLNLKTLETLRICQ